jgi:hypothetical protein
LSWTPGSPAAYFGTWFFLFFLGALSRALLAAKTVMEGYWFHKYASTAVVVSTNDDGKVKVVSGGRNILVWRTSVDIPRSFMQLIISGVNYLLYVSVERWTDVG